MGLIGRMRALLRSSGGIAVAISVMNGATYGFTLLSARLMGPVQYGALVAALNFLLVMQVVALGLQATAARRIAAEPQHVAQIEQSILRMTLRVALVLGASLGVLSPLIDRVLQLDSLATAAIIAVSAVPLTITGGQAGILQGERRWLALGILYMAAGVPRLVVGLGLVAWRPDATSAVLGVAIGLVGPVVVGWIALRHRRRPDAHHGAHRAVALVRESLHNSQALFAYFALSNGDIIVARHVLERHDSGLYAAGLIMTKAMLFLPQFVVVVAYPAMATPRARLRALTGSLVLVALLGSAVTVVARLASPWAMVFVGGEKFGEIQDRLWIFAALGTVLAMLQLLVYAVLARQGRRSVLLVWAALAALIVAGTRTGSLDGLIAVVVSVNLGLLVLLLAATAFQTREQDSPTLGADPHEPAATNR